MYTIRLRIPAFILYLVTFFLVNFSIACSLIPDTKELYTGNFQVGTASWYGGKLHGCITASGEKYDMNKFTAAHRNLPFGTLVRVKNIKNDKSAIVCINDRGPWIQDRIIDLSYAAAKEIGMYKSGVAEVSLEIVNQELGLVAWYSSYFHGRKTASGELYDVNKLTAAHRTLPFGTIVKVTNVDNGKSVKVRINDRMPKSEKNIINISRKAALKIGIIKTGSARVTLDIVKPK